ncbi:MAG: Ig-like domain-containing protein [Oscillospiraceae bacterium]|nr:Ig-like domain-containing protein [Oscillospiraceae bacterium]
MATQQDTPRRSDVVRCEFCGEDYSVTYRKCPFCDDMAGRPAPRPTANPGRGGKRQIGGAPRGGAPMEPVRIIGYALGIILIIAAIYIVYTMLAPLFGGSGSESSVSSVQSSASSSVSASQSQPDVSIPDPAVSTSAPGVITPQVKTTAIALSTTDFTLKPDETAKIVATLTPANSDEEVVWTSSDTSIATVAADGSVTNVNTGSSQKVVTVTATSGSVSAECIVRCKPGSSGTAAPPTPTTPTTPGTTTTPVASGTVGVINSDGVRIRTAPVSGEQQDTGYANSEVTILEKTSDGWYKIRYNSAQGQKEGYISAQFVDVKSN